MKIIIKVQYYNLNLNIYIILMDKLNYKLIIVFVGLPASGKSYTSNHIKQYLTWLGYNIKIFNCGDYRRKLSKKILNSDFFDNDNCYNQKIKESYFYFSMFDLNYHLRFTNTNIGILDATNSTKKRRNKIVKFFSLFNYQKRIIFLENITNDPLILKNNINFKKSSPDYKDKSVEFMMKDFNNRLDHYRKVYEDIEDDENIDYVKIYNCGKKVIYNNIFGHLETIILNYIINFRVNIKKIYLTRHGESLFNVQNRIGGDPSLTNKGIDYSKKLFKYISIHYKVNDINIFTSNLKRTKETSELLIKNGYDVIHKDILNEIDGGICENMTYEEVKNKMPELYKNRKKDKFNFKYPEGESYNDLIFRIKEFILEINRLDKPILIITHNAVIRVILCYFLNISHKIIPHMDIPLHSLYCIENENYFYKKTQII